MSGFVAASRHHPDPDLPKTLYVMSQVIAHRGDLVREAVFSDTCAAETRFREHSGFRVHTCTIQGHGVVLDGLIFNWADLEKSLGDNQTRDVAEIILLGYLKFGNSWFSRIDGCFALMITNLATHEITLVRDRFGGRPLYFGSSNGSTWVASEIKAILSAPGFPKAINKDAIRAAIAYGMTPGPETLFQHIYKCLPGFVFKITGRGDYDASKYFAPSPPTQHGMKQAEAEEFITCSLRQTIAEYARECPDLGVLLSGGVDSALVAQHLAEANIPNSMAISFGASAWADDESGQAGQIAKQLNLPFARTIVTPDSDILGSIRNAIWQVEDPTRFEWAIAHELGCREAAGRCRGLLTGYGSDTILGSSDDRDAKRISQMLHLPGFLRSAFTSIPLKQRALQRLKAMQWYAKFQSLEDYVHAEYANGLNLLPGAKLPPPISLEEAVTEGLGRWPAAAQCVYIMNMEFGHCFVEALEKLASSSSLECFHPYMRNDLFEFGLALPDQLRNRKGISKPALRSLAARRFGDAMAHRRKLQYNAPMRMWLDKSEQLRAAVLQLKHPDSRIRSFMDNDTIDTCLVAYEKEGAGNNPAMGSLLFRMLGFELWLEMYF